MAVQSSQYQSIWIWTVRKQNKIGALFEKLYTFQRLSEWFGPDPALTAAVVQVAVASCGGEDGSPTPPSKMLEFGGHVLDERMDKRPLREVQNARNQKPGKNESPPSGGGTCSASASMLSACQKTRQRKSSE